MVTEQEFDELRPSAFAVAYRMLGSVSEAEDVVQEGFLRLHRVRAGGERIESPRAYLSTVVSRLSLDQLRSARANHTCGLPSSTPSTPLPHPFRRSAERRPEPAGAAAAAPRADPARLGQQLQGGAPEQRYPLVASRTNRTVCAEGRMSRRPPHVHSKEGRRFESARGLREAAANRRAPGWRQLLD